jgi:hypothetical protein
MVMTKVLIGILAVALASSAAWANLANGDFESGTITNQATWTAGTDALGSWYGGSGWVTAGTSGSKIADQTFTSGTSGGMDVPSTRTLLQALPISAGTYSWTVESRNSDPANLYGLAVVLAKDSAAVSLSGGFFWPGAIGTNPPNTKMGLMWDPSYDDVPDGGSTVMHFDGQFHTISNSFTITPQDALDYKYVIFVAEGNQGSGQVFSVATESTDLPGSPVPEPMTMASVFMALGGLGAWVRRRMAKPQA